MIKLYTKTIRKDRNFTIKRLEVIIGVEFAEVNNSPVDYENMAVNKLNEILMYNIGIPILIDQLYDIKKELITLNQIPNIMSSKLIDKIDTIIKQAKNIKIVTKGDTNETNGTSS